MQNKLRIRRNTLSIKISKMFKKYRRNFCQKFPRGSKLGYLNIENATLRGLQKNRIIKKKFFSGSTLMTKPKNLFLDQLQLFLKSLPK